MIVSSVQGTEIAQATTKATADTQKSAAASSIRPYYFSPALVIDPKSGTDVLEYRNSSTGAVINQYPSEKNIKAYSQTSAATEVATSSVTKPAAQAVVSADNKPASDTQKPQAVSQTAVVV